MIIKPNQSIASETRLINSTSNATKIDDLRYIMSKKIYESKFDERIQ